MATDNWQGTNQTHEAPGNARELGAIGLCAAFSRKGGGCYWAK